MASGVSWNDVFCPDCGKQVEILNRDLQLSMELHKQTHKPLEIINQAYNMDNISNPLLQSVQPSLTDISYHGNKEKMGLKNNVQQTIKDSFSSSVIQSVDPPPTSSTIPIQYFFSKRINLLSDVFSVLPSELKPHQGFITENEKGNLYCKICKLSIHLIRSLNEHLKTRLHEDRTIKYFKDTLSNELHHIMEFVSFSNSNLCCNLCRFSFCMCPDNPDETIFSIMKHNLSKGHLERTTQNGPNYDSNEACEILKSFSQLNQVINNNQHLLEFKTHSEFVCKLCKVVVGCNVNETSLYESLIKHFMSQEHLLNFEATCEIEAYNNVNGKQHNFTVSKGNIYCSICNCQVISNSQALSCHVKQKHSSEIPHKPPVSSLNNSQTEPFLRSIEKNQQATNNIKSTDDSSVLAGSDSQENKLSNRESISDLTEKELSTTEHTRVINVSNTKKSKIQKKSNEEIVQSILRSLPQQVENSHFIVQNGQDKLQCSICVDRKIHLNEHWIKQHLLGKRHQKRMLRKLYKGKVKSLIEVEQTINNFQNTNDLSISPGIIDSKENQSGNPESLLAPIPQQSNITQSVYEPNGQELSCDVKPSNTDDLLNPHMSVDNEQAAPSVTLPHNMPHTMLSEKSRCAVSRENILTTANHSKNPNILNTLHGTDSQQQKSDFIPSILRSIQQEVENSESIVQNEQGKLMCSICNCEIPPRVDHVKEHLIGQTHAKYLKKSILKIINEIVS